MLKGEGNVQPKDKLKPSNPTPLEIRRGEIAERAHLLQSHVGDISKIEDANYSFQKLQEIFLKLGWIK